MRIRFLVVWTAMALVGCAGNGRDAVEREEPDPADQTPLSVHVATESDTVQAGAGLPVALTVRNISDSTVTAEFSTGQRFDFVVRDREGREVVRWSEGRMFTLALGREEWAGGEERRFEAEITAPSRPGAYVVEGVLTRRDAPLSDETRLVVTPGG